MVTKSEAVSKLKELSEIITKAREAYFNFNQSIDRGEMIILQRTRSISTFYKYFYILQVFFFFLNSLYSSLSSFHDWFFFLFFFVFLFAFPPEPSVIFLVFLSTHTSYTSFPGTSSPSSTSGTVSEVVMAVARSREVVCFI